jgi:hypothetical protein
LKPQLYLTEIVEEIVVAAAEHMHVKMNLLFLMIEYLKEKLQNSGLIFLFLLST